MANPVEMMFDETTVKRSTPLPVGDGSLTPLGFQQITDLSSATALTVPTGAILASVYAETKSERWRDDGTNPTASVGMVIAAESLFVYNGNLSAIRFIETAASAKLNVSYYR